MSQEDGVYEPDTEVEPDSEEKRESSWRAWLPWIVLVIVLLIVAWLIWMYSDFGKAPDQGNLTPGAAATRARVPDVVGMTQDEAIAVLERAGFLVDTEVSYDTLSDPNTVAAQDPAAGTKVVRGSAVLISIAVGTGLAQGADEDQAYQHRVPNVINMTRGRVELTLTSAGYRAEITSVYSSDERRGRAFSQTPVGGATAESGTTVHVLISLGPAPASDIEVPDVRGMDQEEAEATVREAGLAVRSTWSAQYDKPAGLVFQQYPSAGEYVSADTIVYVLIAVPDGQ